MARLEVNVSQIVRKAIRDEFGAHEPALRVVGEVWEERGRQDEKWGEQNHPDGTGPAQWLSIADLQTWSEDWRVDFADFAEWAKSRTQAAAAEATVTWEQILLEEVAEAFAEDDPDKLRCELIQVAAVATQWVEAIDRRRAQPEAAS